MTVLWRYHGQIRPEFALAPGPGEESVWDYPRPPVLEPVALSVEVLHGARIIARTHGAWRVLETASPPTYYLPPGDVEMDLLERVPGFSHCEWKGRAEYWGLKGAGSDARPVAWSYPHPIGSFARLAGYIGFYPGRVRCFLQGERVLPQGGEFYGGWVTRNIIGPWKGQPGTEDW